LEEDVTKASEEARKEIEREEVLKATMNDQIRKVVEEVESSHLQSLSQPAANISPGSCQLKSSCASTEVPVRQDDTGMRFLVDDITAPLTCCELHIPEGNAPIKVATGVVSPIDPMKTPRIHTIIIQPRYASVSVDRVVKDHENVLLDIEGC